MMVTGTERPTRDTARESKSGVMVASTKDFGRMTKPMAKDG